MSPKSPIRARKFIEAQRSAVLSEDGLYRYRLDRAWDDAGYRVLYVMLNPSTADHAKDDPTIRVCVGRTKNAGGGGVVVVNLYAYRASNPLFIPKSHDPIGPDNDAHIKQALLTHNLALVVMAWGSVDWGPDHMNRHRIRTREVLRMCLKARIPVFCLGYNADGAPKHPLRIPYSQPLVPFQTA